MSVLRLDRLLESLAGIQPAIAIFWLGLAVFTAGLAVLMYTRWGQHQPLRKCMGLSLLAHLLLVCYAATIQIVAPIPSPVEPILYVSIGDGPAENAADVAGAPTTCKTIDQPWETFSNEAATLLEEPELKRMEAEQPVTRKRLVRVEDVRLPNDPGHSPIAMGERSAMETPSVKRRDATRPTLPSAATPLKRPVDDLPVRSVRASSEDVPAALLQRFVSLPRMAGSDGRQSMPNAYRLRVTPDRDRVAQSRGGTAETEAAVKAALKWLADNQSADGRWDSRTHGGGKEMNVAGRDRQSAGGTADTAMTGLALLAFLASGHTHLDGPYNADVRRGLEYLMRTQAPDGNLGGQAAPFEFMYCHAMAACAMSEAYGMTRDDWLREPVRRAVSYTIKAQDPIGGGWRYRPGDTGDTSQLGWQLMTLKSAELAGIPIPDKTRRGIIRYLQRVSSGKYGGRASYRPGEPATRSMTAEALVCWQFLGLPREHPAGNEAGDYLLDELPGEGVYNLYYWYYATLGMYQLQGVHWQRWNDALRTAVVDRQIKEGPLAGSFDTSDLWGGYGGRAYTTALAALTLEVYYRFLPLYAEIVAQRNKYNK